MSAREEDLARKLVITRAEFDAACQRADVRMKANNGHSFIRILKTRCQNCGRSPKAKGRCGGWFMTFLDLLHGELSRPVVETSIEELIGQEGE